LNACSTLTAEDTSANIVDVMIGMNDEISDDSAILFAAGFYGALAAVGPMKVAKVANAFAHGVLRLKLEGSPYAMVPVLRIRPGVDPEMLL
jgi:hypothetical protein